MEDQSFKRRLLEQALDDFHYHLGNGAFVSRNYNEAEELYQRSLRHKGDHARSMHNLATTLEALGRPEEAVSLRAESARLSPDAPGEAEFDLGTLYEGRGLRQDALRCYQQAAAWSGHGDATFRAGCMLEELGEHQRASSTFVIAVHSGFPFSGREYCRMASSMSNQMNTNSLMLDEAVFAFRRATETDPKLGWGFAYYASLSFYKKHYDEAIGAARHLLAIPPQEAWQYLHAMRPLLHFGNRDEAAEAYLAAVTLNDPTLLNPDLAEEHLSGAELLLERSMPAKALDAISRADTIITPRLGSQWWDAVHRRSLRVHRHILEALGRHDESAGLPEPGSA